MSPREAGVVLVGGTVLMVVVGSVLVAFVAIQVGP